MAARSAAISDSINADQLRAWKAEHPGAVVVMYVNTSAEVKAETDYCCTSSNAVSVVEHIWREHGPETEILFGPDMWLGSFVARETGLTEDPERYRRFCVWDGECHVHAGIRPDDIARTRAERPDADRAHGRDREALSDRVRDKTRPGVSLVVLAPGRHREAR